MSPDVHSETHHLSLCFCVRNLRMLKDNDLYGIIKLLGLIYWSYSGDYDVIGWVNVFPLWLCDCGSYFKGTFDSAAFSVILGKKSATFHKRVVINRVVSLH